MFPFLRIAHFPAIPAPKFIQSRHPINYKVGEDLLKLEASPVDMRAAISRLRSTIPLLIWLTVAVVLAEGLPVGIVYLVAPAGQKLAMIQKFAAYSTLVWIAWGLVVITILETWREDPSSFWHLRYCATLFASLTYMAAYGVLGLWFEFGPDAVHGPHHNPPAALMVILQTVIFTVATGWCLTVKWAAHQSAHGVGGRVPSTPPIEGPT